MVVEKRQTFQYRKSFARFFPIIERGKGQVSTYKGPKDVLTVIVEVIRSAFKT